MKPQEAIEYIRETNEPLAVVLEDLLTKIDRIDHSQANVIEAFINHMISPGSSIDLSVLVKILEQHKRN